MNELNDSVIESHDNIAWLIKGPYDSMSDHEPREIDC